MPLATLADNTVLAQNCLGANFGEDIYLLSVDAVATLMEQTVNEGPTTYGFSHSDLSVTEIQENLEAELTDPDDIIARERSRRPVRTSGVFPGIADSETVNQGNPKRTKLRFSVGDGHNLNVWVWNNGGGPKTGGSDLQVNGVIYGRWQR